MDRIEPQNERSRRTRAAVLDAAWTLLIEAGPVGTTMAAVAERAGVSRRALYLHFASRADLLLALHAHVDEQLDLEGSLQAIHHAPDAVAVLEAFAHHLARYHSKILQIDLALSRAQDDDPDVAALVAQGVRTWHDGCTQLADGLAAEGRLAEPWTPELAADLLWSFMFPETLDRLTNGRGWPIDRYGELLALLLRRTLVSDEP